MITRRRALLFLAAPAIVRATSLMPVRALVGDGVALFSAVHPPGFHDFDNTVASDLTEESLLRLMAEIQREAQTNRFVIRIEPTKVIFPPHFPPAERPKLLALARAAGKPRRRTA
jgi:hypothetical protein